MSSTGNYIKLLPNFNQKTEERRLAFLFLMDANSDWPVFLVNMLMHSWEVAFQFSGILCKLEMKKTHNHVDWNLMMYSMRSIHFGIGWRQRLQQYWKEILRWNVEDFKGNNFSMRKPIDILESEQKKICGSLMACTEQHKIPSLAFHFTYSIYPYPGRPRLDLKLPLFCLKKPRETAEQTVPLYCLNETLKNISRMHQTTPPKDTETRQTSTNFADKLCDFFSLSFPWLLSVMQQKH